MHAFILMPTKDPGNTHLGPSRFGLCLLLGGHLSLLNGLLITIAYGRPGKVAPSRRSRANRASTQSGWSTPKNTANDSVLETVPLSRADHVINSTVGGAAIRSSKPVRDA